MTGSGAYECRLRQLPGMSPEASGHIDRVDVDWKGIAEEVAIGAAVFVVLWLTTDDVWWGVLALVAAMVLVRIGLHRLGLRRRR